MSYGIVWLEAYVVEPNTKGRVEGAWLLPLLPEQPAWEIELLLVAPCYELLATGVVITLLCLVINAETQFAVWAWLCSTEG